MNIFISVLRSTAIMFFVCLSFTVKAIDFQGTKWSVIDLEFSYKKKTEDPLKVSFGAMITHESGFTANIPGFYNGEDQWIIRFCPDLEGEWRFETYSNISSLAGQEGGLSISANENAKNHGPLVISKENAQAFEYADGAPYFLLAFELDWLFALDWDNASEIPKTESIIKAVAEHKFNHIVMNVYAFDASWGERDKIDPKYNYAEPNVFPFGGSNDNPDYSQLNIDFFNHLDRVIAHLDEKEIIAHLMIYVWNKKVNWPEPGSEADNMYFDYVVKRYQAYPNLVWDISKEALAYGRDDMGYITERIDRLRKLDGHGRLLSVHDYAYCQAYPNKVDFISIQEWRPNLYSTMLEVRKRHPKQPVFNIEHGGYEKTMHHIFKGAYEDPLACIDRNYQCVFAGTYSTYYWQNTSWYEVVYEPFELKQEDRPNFHYYRNLNKLFSDYDYSKLKPHQSTFTPMTLTDHESVYMYYVSRDMLAVTGAEPAFKGKTVRIKWFDPLTGKYHGNQERKFGDGTWLGITKHEEIKSDIAVAIIEIVE